MFILDTDQIPTTTKELTRAITASLRRSIMLSSKAVPVVLIGELPNLKSLAVDVSDGQVDPDQPLPDPTPPKETQSGPSTESFTILGHPISLEGVPLQFDLSAKNVTFAYARNAQGKLIATLQDAADGRLEVQMDHEHLENAILSIAQKVGASSGVTIQKVSAKLVSINPTTADVVLNITAKKFVTAIVRISGRLSINDQMVATATNLNAEGDGMVAGIAVGFIRPHLQQINNQPLPLLAFSLGNVKLRGVEVKTADGLQISARFGSGGE
jgi:hypothetical protein